MSVFPPETFHAIEKQGSLTYCKQIQENLEHSFHDMNFRDLDIFSETPSGNCSKFPEKRKKKNNKKRNFSYENCSSNVFCP